MSDFAALFPPLFASGADAPDVNISVDDIQLPPLERAVDAAVVAALRQWNELEPAATEKALPYMERIAKYQRLVSALLYEDEGGLATEHTAPAGEPKAGAKRARKRQERQRQQLAAFTEMFGFLPDIDALRAERAPSERLQQFVDTYAPKKRRLTQKRSVADTTTAMSFEFARRPPEQNDSADVEAHTDTKLANKSGLDVTDPILWIDVLHPSKDAAKTQSFLVRSSQTLADVVDLVACAYDERLRDHNKHGSKLVFFDGRFYADTRTPSALDYSVEIRAWIRAKPERIAKFGEANEPPSSLHTTRFADLKLRVDVPGLYIHQGECEHLLRLRDVRLPLEWDAPAASDIFPLRLPNMLYRALRNCFICQHYSAKYVCYGDRLSVADPMFFCDRCYRVAHYGPDGKLLYNDFQSFPYIQE